jgi:hypothetical protein
MKRWWGYAIVAACILAATLCFIVARTQIARANAERDRYKGNTEALLTDVELFRVRDSLNAARVQSLELTVKEFERFRADDAELIRQLKERNRDLATVNKTQSQTIIDLRAVPKDTIVIVKDSIRVPAVAVHCGDSWFDFDGVLTADEFTGTLQNRDSLLLAETVKYKRFLGFLWKTRRVQDRKLDVVSKNPHTQIMGLEYVVIERK